MAWVQKTVKHKKAVIRTRSSTKSNGVVRIKRDSYSNASTTWYTIKAKVLERDRHKCVQCSSTAHLNTHHIRPLSKGGRTIMSNLITLCEDCHSRRHRHLHKGK